MFESIFLFSRYYTNWFKCKIVSDLSLPNVENNPGSRNMFAELMSMIISVFYKVVQLSELLYYAKNIKSTYRISIQFVRDKY